jgi:hypothetical protein
MLNKKHDGQLVLPEGALVLTGEEMRYVEGGGFSITTNLSMLNKTYCANLATKYKSRYSISVSDAAMEIYAHAKLYFGSVVYGTVARKSSSSLRIPIIAACNEIASHARVVNIGGDNFFRKTVYALIWAYY